ncbi:2-dehydropantoate 2-reductase [Mycobacteroides salmoniphilum]|uniref:2-dehydropantoate 2-reductase n=1 Tax=Mycobacteroides salmoniphilum TaxID=404941 RepID=UPI0010670A0F|nr:2-dehydropantoate 2-reductase [Mycobacteroides salmoniphilum]TDZ99320.1 2-dehydropantoate 2-reductase [Mycobacteroides salmoniphilum]
MPANNLNRRAGNSVAIIGAGAVAGLMASWLRGAGQPPPVVCARTSFDAFTITGDGFGSETTQQCPVTVVTSPDAVTCPVEWVFVTVKAHDTATVKPWLDVLTSGDTVVVVLQNGVDHVERAQPVTGAAEILPALIFAAAERTGPATIHHRLGAALTVPNSSAGRAFAAMMAGGVHVIRSDDFLTECWRKLLVNIGVSLITALTLRNADVLREPDVERICASLLAETRSAGDAAGAHLTDADVDNVMALYRSYPDDVGSSMLYDRLAGRPLEYDLLLGAVLRAARSHNIAVPIAETLFALTAAAHSPPHI